MGWSVPDEKREEFSGRVTGNSELSFQGACDSPGEDPTALLNGCPQEIASARRIEVNHLADTTASEGKDSFTDPGSVTLYHGHRKHARMQCEASREITRLRLAYRRS